MNKIYSQVWNKELGQLVVASEFAKSDSTGVLQGEGGTAPVTRSLLAVVFASLFAVAGYGPAAFAQEWTVTDGATVGFQGDSNINVSVMPNGADATVEINLAPDLVVDSVTTGDTVMNNAGVAVGANVVLGTSGLSITGGPSVTLAGIDAGNTVITNVAAGGNASDAVNFGQLQGVESSAQAAATAASVAQSTADNALTAAGNAQTTADAAVAAAGAGWDVSADSGSTANIGSGGSVAFSGDSNISVAQSGGGDAGAIDITLNPDLNVTSVTAGNTTVNNDGLTITGGPSVTASGLDAGGTKLTGLANGTVSADSTDAITGQQLHNVLFEGGSAFGVRYFRANSTTHDAVAAGVEAVAIGPNTRAEGASSFAAGDGAATTATAEGSIALGQGAVSGTEGGAVPDGDGSIAIGRDSQASGNRTVALGDGASVTSEHVSNATALGAGASVTGDQSSGGTAVGADARAGAANATALGINALASAASATALGSSAQASGANSIAIGNAEASGPGAFAAGDGAYAATPGGIALGIGAGVGTESATSLDRQDHIAIGTRAGQRSGGNQSIAIGADAGSDITGYFNVAVGVEAGSNIQGNSNVSIGNQANKEAGQNEHAIAIGGLTKAATDAVSIGWDATSLDTGVAIGSYSDAGVGGVALGRNTSADGGNVALGFGSVARKSDASGAGYITGSSFTDGTVVSVGNTNPVTGGRTTRRIVNVADGSQGYDAVNVRQLEGAQRSVATLVGGGVTLNGDGTYSPIIVDVAGGGTAEFATVVEAIGAVTSGAVDILPVDAVRYNAEGGISNVIAGTNATDAVNVEQLNQVVEANSVRYFHVNSNNPLNRDNTTATGIDSIAIGPDSHALAASSLATGHQARAAGQQSVAIGSNVEAHGDNSTVLGSHRTQAYGDGGIAIGQNAESHGLNSIVMGTGGRSHPQTSGNAPDNTIVIGTSAEATADNGIAIGEDAEAVAERAMAQGYGAYASGVDASASGSNATASGTNAQASGTSAQASGTSAQASGTSAQAAGLNAIATGTEARGHATDGIALGTGAVAGFTPNPAIPDEVARNHGSIAIGDSSRADNFNALALGVEADARGVSSTAIGEGAEATASAEDGLAVGSGARVTAQNASAIGQGANAMHEGSVALGSGAQTAAAVGTASYTVDKNTYDFAGIAPVATVSVGAPGQERTITNVAAGRISAQSTDAINGSQLYGTNQAVDALADDLDTAGQSVAAALGGTSSYNPETHTVTAELSVQGNNYTNVQEALTYVGQGWNVSAEDGATANVAPGGSVDFSSDDGNIVVSRDGTNLVFDLDDEITIGESISFVDGDTFIDGDSVTTTNLNVGGDTFVVEGDTVTYNGLEVATQDDGLSFAGNTGGNINKTLGDGTPLTISGGLAGTEASTGANLRVDSDGNQLNLVMARDLTDLDSITINNGGPVIGHDGINMGDNQITNLAAGTSDDHAVNLGQLREVEEVANRGWDVGANGEATGANVAPGGSVDFSNTDENIVIARDGTDLTFDLADDLEIGNSITFVDGDTVIDGDSITTNNLTVEGDTQLGDHFTVNEGGVFYDGPITEGDHIVNKTYVDGEIDALANTPLTFAGDAGDNVDRLLGETVNLVGGADESTLTDGNIGVVANGDDTLEIKLNKDIDLGEDGSLEIGDTLVDTDGLVVTDDDGNVTVVAADGTTVEDDAGNVTTVAASNVTVTDGDGSTSIGAGVVTVAGTSSTITIDGDAGTIGGLTNTTIDYPDFADGSGRAATEEQLDQVNQTANAGWNLTGSGADEVNIGPNGSVDFQGDQNITVAQTGNDQDGVIEVTLNRDLDVDSVTAGDTVVDGTGVGVGDDVHLGDTGLVIGDADGPRFTNDGISAGGQVITNVAPGVDGTDAVNVDQLTGLANTPLTFAGDAGTDVDRLLGETVNLVGGAIDETTLTDGNIGVVADGSDTLEIKLNKDIDLGEDGSLEIGDTLVDTDGLVVTDDDGNVTVVAADGTKVEDDAGNVTTVAAGNVTVTDGDGSTSIGAGVVTVTGTSSTITIDGDAGTIGGLTNTTFDPNATYTGGVAATQEQLSQVNTDLTAAGLDFVGDDGQVVHRDLGEELSITGGADLDALSSGNIGVTSNDDEDGLVIELADNIELTEEGSISIGDTYIDGDEIVTNNLTVGGTTQLGDHFTVNEGGVYYDGPITEGDHIVNKTYVDDGIDELANTPLTFAGDAGDDVERRLGETVNLVGGATDEAALTEGNIGVVADGTDTLEIKLNKDIDLGSDGSVAIGNTTVNNAGLTVAVATGSTTVGAGFVSVEGAGGTVMVDGNLGTIGGLTNTTFDPDNYTSGQAATEDQLKQVSDVANAGWNVSVDGEGAVADNNVGPGGTVDFSNNDGNIEIDRDGTDLVFDLADDITVDSVTAGDTYIDTTGVAVGADVHLGNTGLVIHGGPSVTITGINAGNLVITNVAPGEISATSTDAINGSQLHGMGDSIVNVIGGNAELNPDGTITTSDIGGTGHDNIDDAIRAANDAANAGWTATDADGNAANIGPNGSVTFTGDGNISVAQTGEDNAGEVQVTLNRDLDVDSITAGNTVIDTDGVQVGDNVHLGDTGLVIEGGPSVTTDGIDAGGSTLTNVAAGVNDTDAVNVGQLNQVAGDVNDLGDRMDVVEGDVADLQAGATGPFQVSQEAPLVPPTPTGANSAAGGSGADASGDNATALGNQAVASGENSTAVGQGAQATHDNSVALGQGSATTVGAQSGYDAAYVGSSDSAGEVNVGNRTISGVAPGVAGTDAVNVNQLNAGVNHAVVTANEYTDQRVNQVQSDVWHLHGRVDDLEKSINSGVATAMAMRQAPYVAGATTYFAGFGAYKDQGALGVSMRRTADNGRWSLEGGFSANRDGAGGYIGVSGVLGSK